MDKIEKTMSEYGKRIWKKLGMNKKFRHQRTLHNNRTNMQEQPIQVIPLNQKQEHSINLKQIETLDMNFIKVLRLNF